MKSSLIRIIIYTPITKIEMKLGIIFQSKIINYYKFVGH